jgi:hypothetical protein
VGSRRDGNPGSWGLDFYTLYLNRMSIAQGGNVGIGTTTPSEKLEINGNLKVSGNIIGSTPWTALPFNAGFGNVFVGQAAQYRKIGDIVYLRGGVRKLDGANISYMTLAKLPVGFRPPAQLTFETASYDPDGYRGVHTWLDPNGDLNADEPNRSEMSLDGVFFSVSP